MGVALTVSKAGYKTALKQIRYSRPTNKSATQVFVGSLNRDILEGVYWLCVSVRLLDMIEISV